VPYNVQKGRKFLGASGAFGAKRDAEAFSSKTAAMAKIKELGIDKKTVELADATPAKKARAPKAATKSAGV
jgi:hypothetical protein